MHDTNSVFKELNGFLYKMHVFRELQFVSHCHTVVSCQQISRHSIYKNSAAYLSGAIFCVLHDTRFMFPDYYMLRKKSVKQKIKNDGLKHWFSIKTEFVAFLQVQKCFFELATVGHEAHQTHIRLMIASFIITKSKVN